MKKIKYNFNKIICSIIIYCSIFIPYIFKVPFMVILLSFISGIMVTVMWNNSLFKSIFLSTTGLKIELNHVIKKVQITLKEFLDVMTPIIEYSMASMEDPRIIDSDIKLQNEINIFQKCLLFLHKYNQFDDKNIDLINHIKNDLMGKLLRSCGYGTRQDFFIWTDYLAYMSINFNEDMTKYFLNELKYFDLDMITDGLNENGIEKFHKRLERIKDFIKISNKLQEWI